jgi:hypothetical protein
VILREPNLEKEQKAAWQIYRGDWCKSNALKLLVQAWGKWKHLLQEFC